MPVQAVAAASSVGRLNGGGGSLGTLGFRSYQESLEWPSRNVEYQNGWVQQENLASVPRRLYSIAVRLTAARAQTFKSFYDSHDKTVPFEFTELRGGTLKIVRFSSGYSQSVALGGLVDISFTLVEVI